MSSPNENPRDARVAPAACGHHQMASSRSVTAPSVASRSVLVHEVPRITADLISDDNRRSDYTAELLHIVEEQSRDLLKLRRALAAANKLAEHRLQIIKANRLEADPLTALVQVHGILEAALQSPWRKLGLKLGFVKRLPWESGRWRSRLVDKRQGEVSDADPLSGVYRVQYLLEWAAQSRWHKLGRALGIVKRLPWEPGGPLSRLIRRRRPLVFARRAATPVRGDASPLHEKGRYASLVEYATIKFLDECRSFGIDVILDVGANTGQFAQSLRECGYRGHIVSFEPMSAAHSTLEQVASSDPLWDIVEPCAVGAEFGQARINIAGNSYSSSLFPMLERHRKAAPESEYKGVEDCRVITLDEYIDTTFSDPTMTFGLKIDTQGYEAQVLAGLRRNHDRVKVILCEMSLSPLYEGAPTMQALAQLLAELGYRCAALAPEFEDPSNGELLQVNGIFVKG